MIKELKKLHDYCKGLGELYARGFLRSKGVKVKQNRLYSILRIMKCAGQFGMSLTRR